MTAFSSIKKWIKRKTGVPELSTKPVSTLFGFDRGTPVDRYYIETFLQANSHRIQGTVLEIAESLYTKKFGNQVTAAEVLHTEQTKEATIVGDLANTATLPAGRVDCFICTQTFNFIYRFQDAIRGAFHLLKENGVLLVSLAGICQISKYDMDRWGDYWRFTQLSAKLAFEEVFGPGNVIVDYYGNALAATAFLQGLAAEELDKAELDFKDAVYPIIITVVATKKTLSNQ